MKGYKVTTIDRKQKYGIAADSLKSLINKASIKLKVKINKQSIFLLKIHLNIFSAQIKNCRVYLAKDGTEVQDENYFETIDAQTLFVIASASDEVKTGLYHLIYRKKYVFHDHCNNFFFLQIFN